MTPRSRTRSLITLVTGAVLLLAGGALAAPAAAAPDATAPPATGAPTSDAEMTITEMRHQGGVYGTAGEDVTALTPYPSAPVGPSSPYETAQIVLEDPHGATGAQSIAYCIDIDTDTTIGVHYELGEWTSAEVPNLTYVTYILQNYYPAVPAEPAGTDVQRVEAVQAAIWYFTDGFVLGAAEPQRAVTAAIVAAAQSGGGVQPALPTLTITPADADAPSTGQPAGPFVIGGTATGPVLSTSGVDVYADADGDDPIAPGSVVAQGASLWTALVSDAAGGFALTSLQTVPAGNVFVYAGGNDGRSSAQKLILAEQATVPVRAAATVTPYAAGTLQVDVIVDGDAAGSQGDVFLDVLCDEPGWAPRSASLAGAAAPGRHVVSTVSPVPAGAECRLEIVEDGADGSVAVTSATLEPADRSITEDATVTLTATIVYSFAGPAPTPDPLPPTGGAVLSWAIPTAFLAFGGALVALDLRRRRAGTR